MTPTLAVMGDLLEDVVVWLHEPLAVGTDCSGEIHRTRGGSAANVAAAAATLGAGMVAVRFLGCVGPDAAGDALVAELVGRGVDVRVQRRGTTGAVVILVDSSGERTMIPNRMASGLLERVDDDWLDEVDLFHVPAYGFCAEPVGTTAIDALRRVRAAGGVTSIDASSVGMLESWGRDRIIALLADLAPDHLLANADEAEFLRLLDQPGWAARTTLVVKRGAAATLVIVPGDEPVEVPVSPVPDVLDSTGAGDAFAAGYLTAVLQGNTPEAAAAAGNVAGGLALSRPGAL